MMKVWIITEKIGKCESILEIWLDGHKAVKRLEYLREHTDGLYFLSTKAVSE